MLLCTSQVFDASLPESLETHIKHAKTGATRVLRLNASRLKGKSGLHGYGDHLQGDGFICVLGDISAARELDRVKESYIATLTHDLRTPLLAQEMVLSSLLSGTPGNLSTQQDKLIGGARQSVQDLLEMVNSTLIFYQLENSNLKLQTQKAALHQLLSNVVASLQPIAESRSLTFQMEQTSSALDVWVDPIQIKRVFHNIISNAISYSHRRSVITISVRPDVADGNVLVEIRNEGQGISPEALPKIFDKYYSLSRKFKQIGTGLGLYTARRIVELHGGKIWAESEMQKETRFYISLPSIKQIS